MILSELHIVNYKNYKDVHIAFHPVFNVVTGLNGQGKTNLIDSIYYLGLTRSYFFSVDTHNYRHETDFFRIQGDFKLKQKKNKIVVKSQKKAAKIIERNNKKYSKLVEHIGKVPVVMIAPKDQGLIVEGSEERRKLVDSTISQLDDKYLNALIEYKYVLRQRNQLLKDFNGRLLDEPLLNIYDKKMVESGKVIFDKRTEYLELMKVDFESLYSRISGDKEKCSFKYKSKLKDNSFEDLLKTARQKDLIMQRSTVGVHKDDIVFYNGSKPIKYIGSQGQQKSFILALKLAQVELIHNQTGDYPILLLDDIFDKLDSSRVMQLIELLNDFHQGQIFITDTEKDRLKIIFKELKFDFNLYEVIDGQVNKV